MRIPITFSVLFVCGISVAPCAAAATMPATRPAAAGETRALQLPVPHGVEQARARAMIRQIFAKDYAKTTAADRRALATLLFAQARETKDDAAARYVALAEAADLAAGAGDAATAVAAADELGRGFAVDALELRRTLLPRAFAAGTTAADAQAVMRLALETAEKAAEIDAFDAVPPLLALAEAAANKTRQVRIAAGIQAQVAELKELTTQFVKVKAALARPPGAAADAASELLIGRFYALGKGQWSLGLPHLAAGSDAELAQLASRKLARPADGVELVALADAWWDFSQKAAGRVKRHTLAHARELYAKAETAITGITLARIHSRLAAADAPTPGVTTALGSDLLALVDPAKNAAVGTWSHPAEGLRCDATGYACLRLPFTPADEYDLHVAFTREAGTGPVAVLLAARGRSFGFALDVKGEARFEQVAGKVAKDNPTVVPIAITNGRPYALTIQIRKDRVAAMLDGKPLVEYKTDGKDLTRYSVWKLADTTVCGLGANNAKVLFHKAEMVDVIGAGKPTR